MYGQNPIRKPLKGSGEVLEVQELFVTLQGEGPHVGMPSIFIRLGGCNLACAFCDTEFESFKSMTVSELVLQVQELANHEVANFLVVITGGEPFRQPIELLCNTLLGIGFNIQIETNGTLYRKLDSRIDIICSPKATQRGYFPLREDVLAMISAFKFIISASEPYYNAVPELGQKTHRIPVFVQPMDEEDREKNLKNTELAKTLALKHGYRLSIQMHKVIGIP